MEIVSHKLYRQKKGFLMELSLSDQLCHLTLTTFLQPGLVHLRVQTHHRFEALKVL